MPARMRYLATQVHLKAKFPGCAAWQIHAQGVRDYQTPEGIRVAPAIALLKTLV